MLSPDEYGGQCLATEENGEVLNDTQYAMERAVEERLNVDIEETLTGFWDMTKTVESLVTSGDSTYNCMTMMDRFAFSAAQNHYFLPVQEVEYIDPTREYWGVGLTESLSVGNSSFFAVSSFNLKSFTNTACVLINTDLASALNVGIPYEKVDDGKWTIDVMLEMVKNASSDFNGDSVMDNADMYGIGMYDRRSAPATMWMSSGLRIIEKDANGQISVTAYDNDEFYSVLEKTQDIFFHGDYCLNVSYDKSDYFSSIDIFKDGRQLILVGNFGCVSGCREMEDDFTILPLPKYRESQVSYSSRTFDSYFELVPTTVVNTAMTGAVLEALSCKAYQTVISVYIETTLKAKYSRDTQSGKYIQLAFDTRVIDMGETFMSDYFGDNSMYSLLKTKPLGIASYLEKNREKLDAQLQMIIDTITGDQ